MLIEFLVEALILSGGGGLIGILLGIAVPHLVRLFAPSIRIEIPALAIVLGLGGHPRSGINFWDGACGSGFTIESRGGSQI